MNTPTQRISEWYASQCNGEWEHFYGVKIECIDNPAWVVTIDVPDREDTEIVEYKKMDWRIKDGKLIGFQCDPAGLDELLEKLAGILESK